MLFNIFATTNRNAVVINDFNSDEFKSLVWWQFLTNGLVTTKESISYDGKETISFKIESGEEGYYHVQDLQAIVNPEDMLGKLVTFALLGTKVVMKIVEDRTRDYNLGYEIISVA